MTTSTLHPHDDTRRAMPQSIASDRLVLRKLVAKDADALQRLANNVQIHKMLARLPHPYTMEDAVDFIDNLSRTDTEHAYAITRDDALVGVTGFHFTQFQNRDVIELGYWLGEPYWGKGYATESATALIAALLAIDPQAPLFARAKAANTKSCNVLEKIGFRPTFKAIDDCGQHKGQEIQYFEWGGTHERFGD